MTTSLSRAEQEALAITNDPVLRKMLDEERIESEEVDIKLFFRLLGYLRPHKRAAAAAVVLSLAESFLMTLPAYVVGLALDRAQGKGVRKAQVFDGLLDTIATSTAQWFDVGDPRTRTVIVFGVILLVVWVARWFIAIVTTFWSKSWGSVSSTGCVWTSSTISRPKAWISSTATPLGVWSIERRSTFRASRSCSATLLHRGCATSCL